ncbi:MAG: hypothetical protein ACLPJH_08970 [Myxococcaceae bacterium]
MAVHEDGAEVASARKRRGWRWLPVLGLVGAALLYATVWQMPALFSRRRPEAPALLLQSLEGGAWVPVGEGARLAARARVRFAVHAERPAFLVLVGLNAEGRATLYVPSAGGAPGLVRGNSTVGEQALDGVAGPELFLAVLCHTPLSASVVLKAAERAVAAAEAPGRVQTLDLGCPEARFLVQKAPLP